MTTRRSILTATAGMGSTLVFTGVFSGMQRAFAQDTPVIRRSLQDMKPDDPDLAAYRDFVGYMQKQDPSKPVSWLQYSLLHGDAKTGVFKYCPHGDWYFLPWHRAYVAMYETAVRALTQKKDFAMPYWDWTLDRTMPSVFTDVTYNGKPNPLYVAGRTLSDPKRWPLPDSIVGPDVMKQIYKQTTYQSFGTSKNPQQNDLNEKWVIAGGGVQGTLEATPHNNVHNFIGAFMPTAGSPLDPIFMMHHCNIDRIWAYWNALGRRNSDGMSATDWGLWNGMTFTNNFLSPTGVPYSAAVAQLQDTLKLGYTYPNLPQHDNLREDPERTRRLLTFFATGTSVKSLNDLQVLASPIRQPALATQPLVKEVTLPASLRDGVTEGAPGAAPTTEVYALIKSIEVGAGVDGMRVFVNADKPSSNTPTNDPHFVAEVGFLAHPSSHHGHEQHKAAPSVLIELTATLRRLSAAGMLKDDRIAVQLVPTLRAGSPADAMKSLLPAVVEIAAL